MLVRSPSLTSHKWRKLVSSGRLVCRCHDVFHWCYLSFVLLRFRLHAFVEAAALRSIVLRCAVAPIATFFFLMFIWRCPFFRVFFVPLLPLPLCMETSTPYNISFRMVFSYLVPTGRMFDIRLWENSIKIQLYQIKYSWRRTDNRRGWVVG